MSCPDLDTLFDPLALDESMRHVASCVDCQRLVVMAASVGGGAHRRGGCDDAELLIATLATGPLEPADERWLTEHLGLCRRCSNVARAVLLDPPAPEIPSASLGDVGQKTVRVAIPIAAVAAVVVLVLVVFSRMGDDERPVVAALPVDSAAMSVDAAALAPPPPVDAAPAADANEPTSAAERREARAAIQAAVGGGSLAAAYAGCDKVRGARWLRKCVALACRAQSELQARRYLARLPERARPRFVTLCRAQGVDVE